MNENIPATVHAPAINVTLSRAAFLALEPVIRCYRANLDPQHVPCAEVIELHNAGLVYAPKGFGGAVYPTDKAYAGFTLVGDTDLGEPRNAFRGAFVPEPVAWVDGLDYDLG